MLSGVGVGQGQPGPRGHDGIGFKLTSDGDYDLQEKKTNKYQMVSMIKMYLVKKNRFLNN